MRKPVLMVVLVVVACSSDGSGVGEEAAEVVCRNWCQPDTGTACGSGDPVSCLDSCVQQAQQTCGEHEHAKKQCQLEMACEDPFQDCAVWDDRMGECVLDTQLRDRCMMLCPENFDACYASGGDCAEDTGVGDACTFSQVPEGGFLAVETYVENSSECATGLCVVHELQGDPTNLQPECPKDEPGEPSTCVGVRDAERAIHCTCQCRAPSGSGVQTCSCPFGFDCQDVGLDNGVCVRGNPVEQ